MNNSISMPLPTIPMAPITSAVIPEGSDWGYQIKWDGVRTLARLDGKGGVEIFGRRIEPRNHTFPEIVELLETLRVGPCILDGEIAFFDAELQRPNFQRAKLGIRKRSREEGQGLIFVMFDMIHSDGEDIRQLPYSERFSRLSAKFPEKNPRLFVTDLFTDGVRLFEWVLEREWEGIISKRLDAPYTEGKNHKDCYKKRKEVKLTADVVGLKMKDGQVSSLVLRYEDRYIGHVSGLDQKSKHILFKFAEEHPGNCPFNILTQGLRNSDVVWLAVPFPARVTALEFTDNGLLRQPKLIGFGAE